MDGDLMQGHCFVLFKDQLDVAQLLRCELYQSATPLVIPDIFFALFKLLEPAAHSWN